MNFYTVQIGGDAYEQEVVAREVKSIGSYLVRAGDRPIGSGNYQAEYDAQSRQLEMIFRDCDGYEQHIFVEMP